jgi:hypothetical protein
VYAAMPVAARELDTAAVVIVEVIVGVARAGGLRLRRRRRKIGRMRGFMYVEERGEEGGWWLKYRSGIGD